MNKVVSIVTTRSLSIDYEKIPQNGLWRFLRLNFFSECGKKLTYRVSERHIFAK